MVDNSDMQKKVITYLLIGLVIGFAFGYFVFSPGDDPIVDLDDDVANTPTTELDGGGQVEVNVVDAGGS